MSNASALSRPRTHRQFPHRRSALLLISAVPVAAIAGFAIASGGLLGKIAIVCAVIMLVGTLLWAVFHARIAAGFAAVELPLLLLLASTMTLRERDVTALATNPLDPAGSFRVLCVGAAFVLGMLALTSRHERQYIGRLTTRPFRLYCLYIGVVFLGSFTSVDPKLTLYHAVELLAGMTAIAGAFMVAGAGSTDRLLRVFYWWTVAELASIWIGAVMFPSKAIERIDSPLPLQLNGVFPVISSNGVGTIGAIVGIWSLAVLLCPKEPPGRRRFVTGALAAAGFLTLLLAQYRTGYVATVLALLVLLTLRKRALLAVAIASVAALAWIWGSAIIQRALPFALRGQTSENAAQLTGRFTWWAAAIPVWKESPLIGRGLLTATRFEVLNSLGFGSTSTIHNTWVEALVGTGVIGLTLLVASFLTLFVRASREALNRQGRIVPLLLLVMIAVRSLTGSTIEALDGTLLFGALALSFRDAGQPTQLSKRSARTTRS